MKRKHAITNGVILAILMTASLTTAQKPTPLQPAERPKPRQPSEDVESRLKAAEDKADRALMEKDYIERIQKEATDYYDKAFETQLKYLQGLIILVAAVPVLIGLLGLRVIDRTVEHAVANATTKFGRKLTSELQNLEKSSATLIEQLQSDVKVVSDFEFHYVRGMAALAAGRTAESTPLLRRALANYKSGRARRLFDIEAGTRTIRNLFVSIRQKDPAAADVNARLELADPFYKDLDDELNEAARTVDYIKGPMQARNAAAPLTPEEEAAPRTSLATHKPTTK